MSGDAQDKGVDPRFMEEMKKRWGLDQPIHIRYLTYLKNLAVGDLGLSYLRREKVSGLIASRLWPTLKLALVAMLIAVSIGIPLGFYSALRQGTWLDAFSMVGAVSGVSIPQFWLGLLLMFFLAVKLPLFPVQGYGDGDVKHILLPAFTLGVGYMALLARTTRAAVVEILTTDYIRTARAKGLSELMVNRKHILRNALILVLTTAGLQFGSLMGQHGDRGEAFFLARPRLADGGFHFHAGHSGHPGLRPPDHSRLPAGEPGGGPPVRNHRSQGGVPVNEFFKKARRQKNLMVGGIITLLFVVMAIFAPWLAPFHPIDHADLMHSEEPPNRTYLFGTDQPGKRHPFPGDLRLQDIPERGTGQPGTQQPDRHPAGAHRRASWEGGGMTWSWA